MTAEEILQRIVRAHLGLLICCLLVPLVATGLMQFTEQPQWTASVRLQSSETTPSSSTEAEALSSRVLAVATTSDLVKAALKDAGLSRDAQQVAEHGVTVARLGESAIVELRVTDHQRTDAGALVVALSKQVIDFLNRDNRSGLPDQLDAVNREIRHTSAQRDALLSKLTGSGPLARQALLARVSAAEAELGRLADERTSLVDAERARDVAVPIDGAQPLVTKVPSRLIPRTALALLLGLVVGLALASGIETLRPRVAGLRALARRLDAPVLGQEGVRQDGLLNAMTLSGRRHGVETIVLLGVNDADDKAAARILSALPRATTEAIAVAIATGKKSVAQVEAQDGPQAGFGMSSRVRFTDLTGVTSSEEHTAGVVVVSHGNPLQADVDALEDVIRAMRWPVVGVIDGSRVVRQ